MWGFPPRFPHSTRNAAFPQRMEIDRSPPHGVFPGFTLSRGAKTKNPEMLPRPTAVYKKQTCAVDPLNRHDGYILDQRSTTQKFVTGLMA